MNLQMLTFGPPQDQDVYQVMLVDSDGPRWSQPFREADEPFGDAEPADVLDVDGQSITPVTVCRTTVGDQDGSTVLVPPPQRGWNSVRLRDGTNLAFSAPVTVPRPQ
jgi:hypothetical protein